MNKIKYLKNQEFELNNPSNYNDLYFPLFNLRGLKSSITPSLNGDIKINQSSFLLYPTSSIDLKTSFMSRSMYIKAGYNLYNINGNTPRQMIYKDRVDVKCGMLYQNVIRQNTELEMNITSFIPLNDNVELNKIVIKNKKEKDLKIKIYGATPLYSRSADNIRDHRHVTSLLNKSTIVKNGIINKPEMSFNESGHHKNELIYGGFIYSNISVDNYYPDLDEFIGDSIIYPDTIKENVEYGYKVGDKIDGKEVLLGVSFKEIILKPSESISFLMGLFISSNDEEKDNYLLKYSDINQFDLELEKVKEYFKNELKDINVKMLDENYEDFIKWVSLEPILRKNFGCSFLPHHDYGKGGKGWRDLWQDLLALLLLKKDNDVREELINNFAGVRIDGSNATIIGNKKGEFLADRNNIVRVWMDHGAWPFITTNLYINETGDYKILFENQTYFDDQFSHYTHKLKAKPSSTVLKVDGKVYEGTILEHLILQNLVPIFNLGEHGMIKLEDADWNDGMDMGKENGESVAFTCLYAKNLMDLGVLLQDIGQRGIKDVEINEDIISLFDISDNSIEAMRKQINNYFDKVSTSLSNKKIKVPIIRLSRFLMYISFYISNKIKHQEQVSFGDEFAVNSYYDNDKNIFLDLEKGQMSLTGQVFDLMGRITPVEYLDKHVKTVKKYLYDESIKNYRLNTNTGPNMFNKGRFTSFSYGDKENGAVFSHMSIMYSNALFKNNVVDEASSILHNFYYYLSDFKKSHIYPGIPEYINNKGQGLYHFLTGSASWYIYTLRCEEFGIMGKYGHILLYPKLPKEAFLKGKVSFETFVGSYNIKVIYHNPKQLDFNEYVIKHISVNGRKIDVNQKFYLFKRHLKDGSIINVYLDEPRVNKYTKLDFELDFSKTKELPLDLFNYEIGDLHVNKELQYYSDKNVEIKDGCLTIVAKKEHIENNEYTSARINTYGKKSFGYGKLVVEAKIPSGKGTWPAIWMMPMNTKNDYNFWPYKGEIDIMEHNLRMKDYIHTSLHCNLYFHVTDTQRTVIKKVENATERFIEYGIIRDENYIEFLVDGKTFSIFRNGEYGYDISNHGWPFNKDYCLILNLAVGGFFGGEVDDNSLPQEFKIKSIKFYKKEN